MRITKNLMFAGVALAALPALAAVAQTAPSRPAPQPMTRAAVAEHVKTAFERVDTNHDGVVTRAEADAQHATMKSKSAERRAERQGERFARLDTDRNGAVSRTEWDAAGKQRIATADRKDGKAKAGHQRGGQQRHGMRHAGLHLAGPGFDRLDTDKNGQVTLGEAQAARLAMFDRMDTNRDGTVTPEERRAAFPKPARS